MPLTPTTRTSLLLRHCDSEDHEAVSVAVNLSPKEPLLCFP
jgi:hypothetical protein